MVNLVMADEANQERERSLAALLIFLIIAGIQYAYHRIDQLKKKMGSNNEKEIQLRGEIKQLVKQASSLTQPSTFAQAAKLRRLAAAKERQLANCQNLPDKGNALYSKALLISKVLAYVVLLIWFWSVPVASISPQLVQPFGRLLSWRTGGVQNNNLMIGIIPWLIVSIRACRFARRAMANR